MRIESIDLLKLLAAYFVIVLHNTDGNQVFQLNFQASARFAVPVFLLISGYFIANKDCGKLLEQMKKVLMYYIKYEILYICTEFILDLLNNNLGRFKMLILEEGKGLLIGPYIASHLWYLINLVWVYLLIYIFKKINKMKLLFFISIVCEAVGYIISNLSVLIFGFKIPLVFTRNFLFYSLFFVLLGMLIKQNIEKYNVSYKTYIVLSIMFFVLQPLERIIGSKLFLCESADCYLTSFMCAIFLFVAALKMKINYRVLEKISFLSGYIYFLHPLIMRILNLGLKILTGKEIEIFKTSLFSLMVYCLFIYIVTALTVIIFIKFCNKVKVYKTTVCRKSF